MLRMPGIYSAGFRRRYGLLPPAVPLLLGLVLAAITPSATSAARHATLVVETDETCVHKTGPDHMVSTDRIAFVLPEGDGPVKLEGTYRLTGSFGGGYGMSGRSVYQGEVQDGMLVLRFGQWYYQGQPMASSDPEMPSRQKPVRIELEPDAKVVIKFTGAHADKAPCSGTVVYRLVMEEESQVWEVFLTGYRHVIHMSPKYLLNPKTKKWTGFDYFHGVTFSYVLSAEFVITKKKGVWKYKSGSITKANVDYDYMQQPELYKVNRKSCPACKNVRQLKGKPIRGDVIDNNSVILHWPDVRPTVVIESQLSANCASGPHKKTCENLKNYAEYGIADVDFFQRAQGHVLPLKEGSIPPFKAGEPTTVDELAVIHNYTLRRLK